MLVCHLSHDRAMDHLTSNKVWLTLTRIYTLTHTLQVNCGFFFFFFKSPLIYLINHFKHVLFNGFGFLLFSSTQTRLAVFSLEFLICIKSFLKKGFLL